MLPGRGGGIGQWMLTEEAIRTEEERVTWQETTCFFNPKRWVEYSFQMLIHINYNAGLSLPHNYKC